jgi:hypothetical protein
VSRRRVLEAAFVLLEFSISFEKNFYRLPFTPPLSGSPYRSFTVAGGHVRLPTPPTTRVATAPKKACPRRETAASTAKH